MDGKKAEKNVHLKMRNVKRTELQRLKKKAEDKTRAKRELRERKSRQKQKTTRKSAWSLSKD